MASFPPQVHDTARLVTPGGGSVDIDVEMVGLVQRVWELNYSTFVCCQDLGESAGAIRNRDNHPPTYVEAGFAEYYDGFAWLKMPLDDGLDMLNRLTETSFRERVTTRWTPGSWRLHAPLITSQVGKVMVARAAHIHFPKTQITELTYVLRSL
ncbi:hypothetical protein [Amycolatopsis nigrescens]|uniref:hypothetical protein n=1 Tax=Amycolatopsis nigrescens TaxID=381445 RepID=UPI0003753C1B|nr:hypothetical protein [Amycolatopsis nigrescens]